ncbi:hypothetical protein [Nesterenkonia rhizosphaerae]|uniref:Signal transduction histidine kinase n=1 Tax=Nesterenkonia rhizosphaerae TaxID=1348272 RepID=A0ABP9G1J7_9MICC
MRGISTKQLALVVLYALALLAALVAVLLEQWKAAAVATLMSMGIFAALVVLTLAAMTVSARSSRLRLNEIRRATMSSGGTYLRRIARAAEDHTARLDKTIHDAEDRREAAEQRMLATLEAHRLEVEERLADLTDRRSAG